MLFRKRTKVLAYLNTADPSPFASLLSDWNTGQMKEQLIRIGLTKPELHIDWLDDHKCIDIQARWGRMYVDIQVEPDSISIAADEIEPDEPEEFPLTSASGFYQTIRSHLESNSHLGTT